MGFILSISHSNKLNILPGKSSTLDPSTKGMARKYALYDVEDFQKSFVQSMAGHLQVSLRVSGMRCIKCVGKLEQGLKSAFSGVKVRCNLARGAVLLDYPKGEYSLSGIVQAIEKLGFEVSPMENPQTHERSQLLRIGVAFFCFMNTMLFATSEYLVGADGMDRSFQVIFHWLSFSLATFAMVYSAGSIFSEAWSHLKRKKVQVDQAIGLAILVAYFYSAWNTFQGSGPLYFDSITALIAFLLGGRFLQARLLQKSMGSVQALQDIALDYTRVQDSVTGQKSWVPLAELKKGQLVSLLPGEVIPVRSRLLSDTVQISLEQLTGEPDPKVFQRQQEIAAGSILLDSPVEVEALQTGSESTLQLMRERASRLRDDKASLTRWTDKLSGYFFGLVLFLAGICLFTYWGTGPEDAISRVVAILLIACPCAFAVAAPLSFSRCLALGFRNQVFFKSERSIENLGAAAAICFDKTGTLTEADLSVDEFWLDSDRISRQDLELLLAAVATQSTHHTLKALSEWSRQTPTHSTKEFKETVGQGVSFQYQGKYFYLGRASFVGCKQKTGYQVYLSDSEKNLLACFAFKNHVMADSKPVLSQLKKLGYKLAILSGDGEKETTRIAAHLGVEAAYGELHPEEKLQYLQDEKSSVVMVGNGFNDLVALSGGSVGVAVKESSQATRNSADVYLADAGVHPLLKAIYLARGCKGALIRAFGFSVVYNLIALTLAFLGFVGPVFAAIAMPINSIIVSLFATGWDIERGR